MPSDSATDDFVSAAHRALLGGLLAVLAILGVGMARGLTEGRYVAGTVGLLVALGAGYWILDLLRQGLAERDE